MKTGLIISRKSELYSIQRFINEAKELEIKLVIASPLDILKNDFPLGTIDFAIPRFSSFELIESLDALTKIQNAGIYCLNERAPTELSKDKLLFYNFCAENKFPTPKTQAFSKGLDFPFVVKPRWGSKGEGVALIESPSELSQHNELYADSISKNIYQEFIEECRGFDLRVLVLGGRILGQYLRRSRSQDFRSNLAQGGVAELCELPLDVEALALTCAKKLPKLRLIGFDFLLSRRGPLFLEANSSPGFEGLESQRKVNVAAEILKECLQ